MQIERHCLDSKVPLVLHGEEQELISVSVNGVTVNSNVESFSSASNRLSLELSPTNLIIRDVPDKFELVVTSACFPEKNTSLMGLYISNGNFFSQCEAEGFRKIT